MGIFSGWHSDNGVALKAEDLATCEGYVTRSALRKLQSAKAAARAESGPSLYSIARLVASRVIDAATGASDRPSAPVAAAPVSQDVSPVIRRVPAPSRAPASAPASVDDHHSDKAA